MVMSIGPRRLSKKEESIQLIVETLGGAVVTDEAIALRGRLSRFQARAARTRCDGAAEKAAEEHAVQQH